MMLMERQFHPLAVLERPLWLCRCGRNSYKRRKAGAILEAMRALLSQTINSLGWPNPVSWHAGCTGASIVALLYACSPLTGTRLKSIRSGLLSLLQGVLVEEWAAVPYVSLLP